ncbi:MAG: GreA/GreB family elongation factor [bacterium]|nr:GreA/GreB family elongation factor [bacterium]
MNIQSLKEQLQQAMESKKYDQIEDIWLSLMELSPNDVPFFYSTANWLVRHGEKERACVLLLLLMENFKEKGDFLQVLEILKKIAVFSSIEKSDKSVRQELINCYQVLLKDHPQKRELIETSGIKGEVKLTEILPVFDQYLYFNIGEYFYRPEWGVGRIIDGDLLQEKKVVIDFEHKKNHSISLDAVTEILTKLETGHFLVIKATDITILKKMNEENPLELLVLLLKSVKQPLTPQKIKTYLHDIVPEEEWSAWWSNVQTQIKKDVRIAISPSTPKTYQWCNAQGVEHNLTLKFDKALIYEKMDMTREAYEKGLPVSNQFLKALIESGNQSLAKNPSLAIEIFIFVHELGVKGISTNFDYTCEEIIKDSTDFARLIVRIKNPNIQLQVLRMIKTVHPQVWPEIYSDVFFELEGARLLEGILTELHSSNEQARLAKEKLDTILITLSQSYKKYPEKFLWICKKRFKEDIKFNVLKKYDLLVTLIKLMGWNEAKNLQTQVKAFLLEEIEESNLYLNATQMEAIYDALLQSPALREFEKDKIKALVKKDLPVDIQSAGDEAKKENQYHYFYATQRQIDAKQQELTQIMKVDIPENIKDIATARAHGDLRENFEYKAARQQQQFLYAKLEKLRAQLSNVKAISSEEITTDKVSIGTKLKLNRLDDKEVINEYTILGPWESDVNKGIISYLAPMANKLLKKRVGDKVNIEDVDYKIIEITPALT